MCRGTVGEEEGSGKRGPRNVDRVIRERAGGLTVEIGFTENY